MATSSSVLHLFAVTCLMTSLTAAQGFDTYGIGAYDNVPAPKLTSALGLKVRSRWY